MNVIPVILIFDVGKTNKKIILFDEEYKTVHEESVQLAEVTDEDGFPCENISELTRWLRNLFDRMLKDPQFDVRAVNFSGYGASFVYVDETLDPVLPLYNYLKPYPSELKETFYKTYGGEVPFSRRTASPVLGSLNSGMQLYRFKRENPQGFANKVKFALHLPQYLSAIITRQPCAEITSIGCHTNLWDFVLGDYHEWVIREELIPKFPPIRASDDCVQVEYGNKHFCAGIGLHDSSAALIPYLASFHEPFILISTGTWSISLNPFNDNPLTQEELERDCLCYLDYRGKPVKASRFFAGYEHDQQLKRLVEHYNLPVEFFTNLTYDPTLVTLKEEALITFANRPLTEFANAKHAYHELMSDIVIKQVKSTNLVQTETTVKNIFVDGGFSKNDIYMNLLARHFPSIEVYAASVPQASALGAAMAIHRHWNKMPLPANLIELKRYFITATDLKAQTEK